MSYVVAKRSMRTVLKKQVLHRYSEFTMKHFLTNFLLKCRTSFHIAAGYIPAELMKRRLKTCFSPVQRNLASKIDEYGKVKNIIVISIRFN